MTVAVGQAIREARSQRTAADSRPRVWPCRLYSQAIAEIVNYGRTRVNGAEE